MSAKQNTHLHSLYHTYSVETMGRGFEFSLHIQDSIFMEGTLDRGVVSIENLIFN